MTTIDSRAHKNTYAQSITLLQQELSSRCPVRDTDIFYQSNDLFASPKFLVSYVEKTSREVSWKRLIGKEFVHGIDCSSSELHPRVAPLQSLVAFSQINRGGRRRWLSPRTLRYHAQAILTSRRTHPQASAGMPNTATGIRLEPRTRSARVVSPLVQVAQTPMVQQYLNRYGSRSANLTCLVL